jgi:enoyl-CoA hydratase/carnithine racemase
MPIPTLPARRPNLTPISGSTPATRSPARNRRLRQDTDVSDLLLTTRPAEGVALLTLNRPDKKNALSIALRDDMSDALDALAADDGVKVVIVTGAGDVFSAGFDLKEFDHLDDEAFAGRLWASSDRWHRTVIEFPLPVIAALNGPALAGGFDLAVMCDIRIASTTTRFAHPEQAFSDVVYGPLHDLVGGAVARDLCLTGRVVEADEALALRLVTRAVEPGRIVDEALVTAAQVARAPRDILLRTKAKAVRRARVAGATLDL